MEDRFEDMIHEGLEWLEARGWRLVTPYDEPELLTTDAIAANPKVWLRLTRGAAYYLEGMQLRFDPTDLVEGHGSDDVDDLREFLREAFQSGPYHLQWGGSNYYGQGKLLSHDTLPEVAERIQDILDGKGDGSGRTPAAGEGFWARVWYHGGGEGDAPAWEVHYDGTVRWERVLG